MDATALIEYETCNTVKSSKVWVVPTISEVSRFLSFCVFRAKNRERSCSTTIAELRITLEGSRSGGFINSLIYLGDQSGFCRTKYTVPRNKIISSLPTGTEELGEKSNSNSLRTRTMVSSEKSTSEFFPGAYSTKRLK